VERWGRYLRTLGPGPNLIVPGIDTVSQKISILETPLEDITIDAITRDNTMIKVTVSTFYRVINAELVVYRISDVRGALRTLVTGVVRSLIGGTELDEVQTNRDQVSAELKRQLEMAAQEWGVEIPRSEITDVNVDEATRRAMLAQITAERERRAAVTRAEGEKRAAERKADAELYTAQKLADARRITADAEAYATETVARAFAHRPESIWDSHPTEGLIH
jgi:regulator of protease activity HflC (stomatin/prohibitin superfamily)